MEWKNLAHWIALIWPIVSRFRCLLKMFWNVWLHSSVVLALCMHPHKQQVCVFSRPFVHNWSEKVANFQLSQYSVLQYSVLWLDVFCICLTLCNVVFFLYWRAGLFVRTTTVKGFKAFHCSHTHVLWRMHPQRHGSTFSSQQDPQWRFLFLRRHIFCICQPTFCTWPVPNFYSIGQI